MKILKGILIFIVVVALLLVVVVHIVVLMFVLIRHLDPVHTPPREGWNYSLLPQSI